MENNKLPFYEAQVRKGQVIVLEYTFEKEIYVGSDRCGVFVHRSPAGNYTNSYTIFVSFKL